MRESAELITPFFARLFGRLHIPFAIHVLFPAMGPRKQCNFVLFKASTRFPPLDPSEFYVEAQYPHRQPHLEVL